MRKEKFRNVVWCALGIAFVAVLYRGWFLHPEIIGGDWPYIFPGMIKDSPLVPATWRGGYGGGAGGVSPAYFLAPYMQFSQWLSVVTHLSWSFVTRLLWFVLPLVIIMSGGYILSREMFPSLRTSYRMLTAVILATNTYMLMITSGGQMGVVLAVSITPWVYVTFEQFRKLFTAERSKHAPITRIKLALLFGIVLGLQLAFDARIGYVQLFGLAGIWIVSFTNLRREVPFIFYGTSAVLTVVLLNAYWVLPLYVLKFNPLNDLGSAYTTVDALRFFSFADFSHAISLLHPNWPENIFGKTYFLQPEFLILPVVAFASFLVRQKASGMSRRIWYVGLLAFLGAFLSKGANPPFGSVYTWMFEHVPGFVMFRDPTKFYVLTVISYSILIPVSLYELSDRVETRIRSIHSIMPFVFLVCWGVLVRQAVIGGLGGTLAARQVPDVYRTWADTLSTDSAYWRTLWVPRQNRFTYTSDIHPSIESEPLLAATDSATITRVFGSPDIVDQLSALSIRYVAVAYDPYGEQFVDDRKYSAQKRASVESALDAVPWLTKVQTGLLTVYEAPTYKPHFYLKETTGSVRVNPLSEDAYRVDVTADGDGTLAFSESYNQGWRMDTGSRFVFAKKGVYGTMEFPIPEGGSHVLIEFAPRHIYATARVITWSAVTVLIIFFVIQSRFGKTRT